MKIYTRTGDDGTTGLPGGHRVRKNDPRINCVGAIDELNAAIGAAACLAEGPLRTSLHQAQNNLFVLGSHIAASPESSHSRVVLPPLDQTILEHLEIEIDAAGAHLPPLTDFILPGGCELAARLHIARTICRRSERLIVDLALTQPLPPPIVPYLNRLSDWLFIMARLANHRATVPDLLWQKGPQSA